MGTEPRSSPSVHPKVLERSTICKGSRDSSPWLHKNLSLLEECSFGTSHSAVASCSEDLNQIWDERYFHNCKASAQMANSGGLKAYVDFFSQDLLLSKDLCMVAIIITGNISTDGVCLLLHRSTLP